jgi:hypothetical protein
VTLNGTTFTLTIDHTREKRSEYLNLSEFLLSSLRLCESEGKLGLECTQLGERGGQVGRDTTEDIFVNFRVERCDADPGAFVKRVGHRIVKFRSRWPKGELGGTELGEPLRRARARGPRALRFS